MKGLVYINLYIKIKHKISDCETKQNCRECELNHQFTSVLWLNVVFKTIKGYVYHLK